jgi:hypothetical protein
VTRDLNATGALGGTSDARIDFDLRNEQDTPPVPFLPNTVYASLRFLPANLVMNLAPLKQITMRIKTDSARTVRIDLNSSKYKGTSSRVRYGWDVMANAAGVTVTLTPAMLGLTPGGTNVGEVLADVLQNVTGLYITALPNGRSAQGLLPAGTTDKGFLQVDDIQISTM